ncbi:MAG: DUF2892 domain-containing protein [Deltaproteobacteria bacterium]|nr:DUF2892 domain-containing protein [Deltaproteobacteria bacterium]
MKKNLGRTDQMIRLVAGLVLLALVFVLEGNARWVGAIGAVLLGTAFMNFCPIYALLRLSTVKK